MARMRNDRARARAIGLLAATYPVPDNGELHRLRELAIDYLREAERLETESKGRAAELEETIATVFDAIARDYFARTQARSASRQNSPRLEPVFRKTNAETRLRESHSSRRAKARTSG
jgi:hypothetical protein